MLVTLIKETMEKEFIAEDGDLKFRIVIKKGDYQILPLHGDSFRFGGKNTKKILTTLQQVNEWIENYIYKPFPISQIESEVEEDGIDSSQK